MIRDQLTAPPFPHTPPNAHGPLAQRPPLAMPPFWQVPCWALAPPEQTPVSAFVPRLHIPPTFDGPRAHVAPNACSKAPAILETAGAWYPDLPMGRISQGAFPSMQLPPNAI